MKSVVIIILTFNNEAEIEPCLNSVFKQNHDGHFEVLVVDNSSSDDTVTIVETKYDKVKLIKNSRNNGYAGGNNLGLKQAWEKDFDYSVLLNPDTEVEENWLKNLVKVAEAEDVGIVQSQVLFYSEKYLVNSIGNPLHFLGFSWSGGYKTVTNSQLKVKEIALASGSSMLIKRAVLEKVGLFDERLFMYHEDVDLCWRARLAGWKIMLAPASKVYHKYSFSFGSKKFFYVERNRLVIFFSNYHLLSIILLLPIFLLTEVAMLVYSIFTGWFRYKFLSWLAFLFMLPHVIKKRREVKRLRTISDKQMIKSMSVALKFSDVDSLLLRYLYNPLSTLYFWLAIKLIYW